MLISQENIEKIEEQLSQKQIILANQYFINHQVEIFKIQMYWDNNIMIEGLIKKTEQQKYRVLIEIQSTNYEIIRKVCSCDNRRYYDEDTDCEHVLAMIYEINSNKKMCEDIRKKIQEIQDKENKRKFNNMLSEFSDEENVLNEVDDIDEVQPLSDISEVNIIPVFKETENSKFEISFKIGQNKMYKIKSLSSFARTYRKNEVYAYGEKLKFKHADSIFSNEAKGYVKLISKYGDMIEYVNKRLDEKARYYSANVKDSYIVLERANAEEIMNCIKNSNSKIEINKKEIILEFEDGKEDLNFNIRKIDENKYELEKNRAESYIIEGNKISYVITESKVKEYDSKKYKDAIKLMKIWNSQKVDKYVFDKQGLIKFANIVIPKVRDNIHLIDIPEKEKEKYVPKKLSVKIKLDLNKDGYIINNLTFCYGNTEYNPLYENPNIPRDLEKESIIISKMTRDGFLINEKENNMVLLQDDLMYEFLSNKINEYMSEYEVLVTDEFKRKEIRQPKIQAMGVKILNNLLDLDLSGIDYDPKEIKQIMEKYKLKKKYHKLKDGTFLDLTQNNDMDFLENLTQSLDVDYSQLAKGKIKLPVNRSIYLKKLMEKLPNTEIEENAEYKELIENTENSINDENIKIPENLNKILRSYQRTGYKWLKILDKYQFGGILADDMGLGKTIQMITLLESEKAKNNFSIVVCPSSLTLNWKNEIEKFSNKLNAIVINGTAHERKEKIKNINKYDVAITSYDLLKRDIDEYENLNFRFIIADEAQYIKNSNTQNAKMLKQLNGKTKFALTGTPIENSLSELWSIFDYAMPGYLFSYSKFKKDFETDIVKNEDEKIMARLKNMIEPFILRRTKKEVLTELPDKTITILNNEMEKEQQKIYLSYLAQSKKEMMESISKDGFEKSQIKILALITRLRQICCYPGLFIDNYNGESGKLNQCMEIVEDAISSNHKILLFSNYTQMFPILENELQKRKIQYYKLTGSTKVDERIKMVDEFNKKDEIKIFLISLKAGGTGLNLTGADVVIHYDPWWNLSAENQATDRAYRIGQKNNVQVYKLITKNSIEEKIQLLQNKKASLADNVLDTKQTFINKMSKDDILGLFSI